MYIKKLTIEHFGRIEYKSFNFCESLNVVVHSMLLIKKSTRKKHENQSYTLEFLKNSKVVL